MRRPAQSLLIILIGSTLLWISLFTRAYLNYVKPYFHPALIASGAIMVLLGATTLTRYARARATGHDPAGHAHPATLCCPPAADDRPGEPHTHPNKHDHEYGGEHGDGHGGGHGGGHEHGVRGPRVAWLLALPVLAIFLLAPPALGSYAAGRDTAPTAPTRAGKYDPLPLLDGEAPNDMYVGEFVGRSYLDDGRTLSGRTVRVLGFVVPRKGGGWYLSRIQISCCAADARAWKIRIQGAAKPPTDSWVQVTGVWTPRKPGEDPTAPPALTAQNVRKTHTPENPYEETPVG